MEFRQLTSFMAIAETMSFRAAAKSLDLSQAAISLHIRDLEREIGAELFTRDRRQTRLTYAGEVFRDEVFELLADVNRGTERVRRASRGILAYIRIGFISTATTARVLPRLIRDFRRLHPHIEMTLQNEISADQVRMIGEGRLDLGMVRHPINNPHGLESVTIFREPHVLLISRHHPLARKPNITTRDINSQGFVMYSRQNAPGYHDHLMRSLNRNGISPTINHEVGEMYTLVSLVSANTGIAIAPNSTRNYRLPGVVYRDLAWLPPAEIALVFASSDVRPATRLFVDLAVRGRSDFDPSIAPGEAAPHGNS